MSTTAAKQERHVAKVYKQFQNHLNVKPLAVTIKEF